MKLSEKAVKDAEPPIKGQRFIFDDHRDAPRGFALRITKAGGKSFVLRYTHQGRRRLKTIGESPTWTLTAAREEACHIKRQVDSGIDVLDVEREKRDALTVAQAVEKFCSEHTDTLKSGKAIRGYFIRDVIPAIGNRKLENIRRRELVELVEKKSQTTPRAAALLRSYLRDLFNWALDHEYIEASPAVEIGRKGVLKDRLKSRKRKRVLDESEIRSLWLNIDTCGLHKLTAIVLKLILLTGQRPGEVAGMRHSEIQGDVWIIPTSRRGKDREDHVVPFTMTVLELIEEAREEIRRLNTRRRWPESDYVFAARQQGGLTVDAIDRSVRRKVSDLGNVEHSTWGYWTPHDLRRTCRTGLAAAGMNEVIAERVIGHGLTGIIAVYNQHAYAREKRVALESWERRLFAIVEGEQPEAKIVSIAGAL